MKPLRVFAQNYATYGDVEWLIPEGVTAILGQNEAGEGISSNGAGKTRLLELLPLALWGPQGSWSDYLSAGSDATCVVGCEFEHAGDVYRVRRTFNPAGRGRTTLDFEMLVEGAAKKSGNAAGAGDPTTRKGSELSTGSHRAALADPAPSTSIPLTRDTQAATQEAIRDLLGIGETTFHQSVFAAQGTRHFADPAITPKERSEILADGLGLNAWDEYKNHAAEDRKAIEAELDATIAQLGQWRQELDQRDTVAESATRAQAAANEATETLLAAREKHDTLNTTYQAARDATDKLADAKRELTATQTTLALLNKEQDDAIAANAMIPALQATIQQATEKIATIPALETEINAINEHAALIEKRNNLTRQRDDKLQQSATHEAEATKYERSHEDRLEQARILEQDEHGTCDRCGQPIDSDALAMAIDSLRHEAERLDTEAKTRREQAAHEREVAEVFAEHLRVLPEVPLPAAGRLEALQQELTDARAAERNLAVAQERLHQHRATVEAATVAMPLHGGALLAVAAAKDRVAALESSVMEETLLLALARDVLGAQVGVDRLEQVCADAHAALGAAVERLRVLDEIAVRNAAAIVRADLLTFDRDVLRELERAYGRSGIPVLLLESLYVPQIEREANVVLEAWGVPFSVELVTQREQKTTDRLRETLEVAVHSPGGVRSFKTFSGGERDRISCALRIALARVISATRGHSLEVFALDELAHLDAAGTEKLAEMLGDLQREIPVVLFISHDSSLTDAFPQRVTVVREGGRSRLEIAA